MSKEMIDAVREKYAAVAVSGLSNEHGGVRSVAEAFGYSADELSSIPAAANMALVTAGAIGGTQGSPSPPRCASDRMNSASIRGASDKWII